MAKDFKTIDEQIEILKKRGLIINDIDFAKEKLLENNYYNVINGYKKIFIKTDSNGNETFINLAKFEELYYLSEFDRSIRIVYLDNILKIENKIKSLVSYYFSEEYGYDNYLIMDNFENLRMSSNKKEVIEKRIKGIQNLISSIQREIANSIDKKNYINHYITKHGYIPLWVLVNALSLGTISIFYEYIKQPLRVKIAKHFNVNEGDLCIYIKMLAFWRNLCAHDERLYDANSYKMLTLPDTKYHSLLNIPIQGNQYIQGKNDLFSLTIVIKILSNENDFNLFYNKINGRIYSIASKLSSVSIEDIKKLMGFPHGWGKIREL
jgi:abortive infection bacteriophage resistance protein